MAWAFPKTVSSKTWIERGMSHAIYYWSMSVKPVG
jgi:hypothetical protein